MPKPALKTNRVIRSPQVLDAFITFLRPRLPLDLQHTRITADDLIAVLAYASVNRLSIEAAHAELDHLASANRLREVLAAALPSRPSLQRSLNTILRQQLPRCLLKGKRSYTVAIDLTLIPYHGQPQRDKAEVVRGAPKAGTTHFHGYATISVVHSKQRYVVALRFIEAGEAMTEIVGKLLTRLKTLGIRLRRLYLDKGFCATPVFKSLDRRGIRYVVPIPVRGKSGGVRDLFVGPKGYWTPYTFHSKQYGAYTVQAVVVRRYTKGRFKRKGVKWFAYAVAGLPPSTTPRQVFELYRQRFGIETSYRQMNQVRARTSTRNPVIRLLLIGLAFILVNLYVALRESLTTVPRGETSLAYTWLTLCRLARLLSRAIEQLVGTRAVFQHRPSTVLS
jgi:putative transposase